MQEGHVIELMQKDDDNTCILILLPTITGAYTDVENLSASGGRCGVVGSLGAEDERRSVEVGN
jgi:hypothetical protein